MKRYTKEDLEAGIDSEAADRVADLLSRLEHVSDEAITVAGNLSLEGYDGKRSIRLLNAIEGVSLEEIERLMTVYRIDSTLLRAGMEAVALHFERCAEHSSVNDVRADFKLFASFIRDYADIMTWRTKSAA